MGLLPVSVRCTVSISDTGLLERRDGAGLRRQKCQNPLRSPGWHAVCISVATVIIVRYLELLMNARNLLLSLTAGLVLTAGAQATPINGSSLQNVLNNITVGGPSTVNVQTDQVVNDEAWEISAASGSVATLIIEIAGFANTNAFGIYDVSNPANYVELFDGAAGAGSQAIVNIMATGEVRVNLSGTGTFFADNAFGFYLDVPQAGERWSSDTALNSDGTDHMVAFAGNDTDVLALPGFAPGLWQSTEYILAFEDLANGGDGDFNDFVVMVASVVPVPEPETLILFALALAGVVGLRRRGA